MSRFDPEKVERPAHAYATGYLVVEAKRYRELYEAAEAMARFLELAFDEFPPQVLLDYRKETEG